MARKILVVEDDHNISDLIRMYLEKEGFEATSPRYCPTARSSPEASSPEALIFACTRWKLSPSRRGSSSPSYQASSSQQQAACHSASRPCRSSSARSSGVSPTTTAPLIRVTSDSVILSDADFINAAATLMQGRYDDYERASSVRPPAFPDPPVTPDPPVQAAEGQEVDLSTTRIFLAMLSSCPPAHSAGTGTSPQY